AATGSLVLGKTPHSYDPGALSGSSYRLTQPLVALRYARSFLLPTHLSADTDLQPAGGVFDHGAWLGFVFIPAATAAAAWCSRRRAWRPAGFGLWWFLLGLVPPALFPLAEVENDHRMYLPFVGLAFAATFAAARAVERAGPALPAWIVSAAAVVLFGAAG